MSIARRSTSSGDINVPGATTTLGLPTGAAATDILIAILAADNGFSTVGTYTAPAGWTAIHTRITKIVGTTAIDLSGFWALGNVASLTFTKNTTPGPVSDLGWQCTAYTGVDNTTPIDVTGATGSNSAANSITAPSYNIVTANALPLIGIADWNGGGTYSATGFSVDQNGGAFASVGLLYDNAAQSAGAAISTVVSDSASATNQLLAVMPFALRPVIVASGLVVPRLIIPQAIKRASYF